jgi:ABC-type Fe3+-hydroxamate transport system substrate-binding protein
LRVGGTKLIKMESVHAVQPDLIIANKEENTEEQIEELARYYPVWVSDVKNLPDACYMIEQLGALTNTAAGAAGIVQTIQQQFSALTGVKKAVNTGYLIWRNPYMTIGGDTFINDMLRQCGFHNVFAHLNRYPEISNEQLSAAGIELLLLPSEPFPFKEKHVVELQQQLPGCRILLVDGTFFSWYGSRLMKATAYFKELMDKIN